MGGKAASGSATSIVVTGPHDRRQSVRFDIDTSLVVRPTKVRNRAIHGRIIDLSRGGVRAVIAADLQVGDALELELKLPYTHVVRAQAVVRSRTHYQYGLEFELVAPSEQEKIDRTCAVLALLQ